MMPMINKNMTQIKTNIAQLCQVLMNLNYFIYIILEQAGSILGQC